MVEIININESITLGILNLKEFANVRQLSAKRDIETQGKQFLINHLFEKQTEINYDSNGKPYLVNDARHISISHSHDKLAIIINAQEVTGIDIELIRDKILRIKHKFLSNYELKETGDYVEKLLIYWAAKETLYKVYGLKEVDFIQHLAIDAFTLDTKGKINGHITINDLNVTYLLQYELLDEYVLVYSIEKIC